MALSSLSDVYRLQDLSWADRPAVTVGDTVLTFGALDRLSNRIARALVRDGVAPEARVAILDKNGLVYPALVGGILKAGGVALPVNFRLVMDEVAFTLEDGDAQVIFVGPDHLAMAAGLVERLPHLIVVDVAGGLEAWLGEVDDGDPDIRREVGAEIVQLYTSGTTGRPKGVCHTDVAYCAITEAFGQAVGLPAAGKEMLVLVPLFHLAGFDLATFALAHGIGIVLQRDVDAEAALRTIESRRVAALMVVPTIIQMLVDAQERVGADLGSLERIYYGASSIPEPLLVRALEMTGGVGFTQCYGMSETNIITTLHPADHTDKALLASCGRALPGCAVRIADVDGRAVSAGELGEVTVKAPWLMPRYWKRPEATREVFRDGWLRTGDAGSVDERGFLFIRDRIKDLIITGGENVYPAEVERVLIEHPALVEVAVFGVPDARWGESVRAAVVPRAGESVTEADLMAFVAGRIARYKQPRSITILSALPRNASGKVLKFRLREDWQNVGLATGT